MGEMDSNSVTVRDFHPPLPSMNTSSRQNFNKETAALNGTLSQMNLINIFNISSKAAEYTFFSRAHGTFSRMDHMLGHKKVSIYLRGLKLYQESPLTKMV